MDMLDKQIRGYLEKEVSHIVKKDRFEEIPSTEEFYQFISDNMKGGALEEMLQYLRNNPEAQNLVAQARMLMAAGESADRRDPPLDWVEKAKKSFPKSPAAQCPYCGKSITPFKKPLKTQSLLNLLWLSLSVIIFSCSFIYRRYFFQCLVLALFFGIKWVVDQRSTKTQILIYKALKDGDHSVHSRDLHNTPTHL